MFDPGGALPWPPICIVYALQTARGSTCSHRSSSWDCPSPSCAGGTAGGGGAEGAVGVDGGGGVGGGAAAVADDIDVVAAVAVVAGDDSSSEPLSPSCSDVVAERPSPPPQMAVAYRVVIFLWRRRLSALCRARFLVREGDFGRLEDVREEVTHHFLVHYLQFPDCPRPKQSKYSRVHSVSDSRWPGRTSSGRVCQESAKSRG